MKGALGRQVAPKGRHKLGRGVAYAKRNGLWPLPPRAEPVRPARIPSMIVTAALTLPLAHGGTGGLLVELAIVVLVLALLAAGWVGVRRERQAEEERREGPEGEPPR